ncbi:MAG: hypothetical protein DRH15_09965 [Deltaproteobacteria bacterium]|nr:MAG: hypothetical protein DRH15_09965 [Deltaproteobacteria bacterium]
MSSISENVSVTMARRKEQAMNNRVIIHTYGNLGTILPENNKPILLSLTKSLSVKELLGRIGVSPNSVQLIMVNHRAVAIDAIVNPGDRISLFGHEYPVFADWLDQRS